MQAELQTALFHAFDTLNLQQMKSFNVPPVTLHGVGALAACGPQAQSRGLRHLFVMVDSFLHQAGMTAGLERSLAMKGIAMTLWPCPAGEPCVTDVCAAVAQLRDARCDGVVAFGGGSVLDAAKAVALLVANPEQTLGEMTEHSELRPRLPLIAVPTTAGTGSETTNVTVIIDAVSGRKQVLAHASLMPDVAILDAALTEGVPPHITAMTGIDALTHAVEAYSARHATPFTDSLARRCRKRWAAVRIWRRGRTCCWLPAWRGWRFPAPGWGYAMPWRISRGRRCIFRTVWPTPCCCQR